MPTNVTPLWSDPLYSPGDLFPLGPPAGAFDSADEDPGEPGIRPFSLRHLEAGPCMDAVAKWRYTYCPERQIALVEDEDGTLVEMLKHTKRGATPPRTSGSADGSGRKAPEEMGSMDW